MQAFMGDLAFVIFLNKRCIILMSLEPFQEYIQLFTKIIKNSRSFKILCKQIMKLELYNTLKKFFTTRKRQSNNSSESYKTGLESSP